MAPEKLSPETRRPKRSSYLSIALILLSSLALMDVSHAAGRVFYDGFEDGTTNAWAQADYHNRCTVVTSALDGKTGPHNGNRMAMCNWNGVVAWNDPEAFRGLELPSWSYNTDFLMRFWVRADADVDPKFGSKWLRYYNSTNSFILEGQMENATSPMGWFLEMIDGAGQPCCTKDSGTLSLGNRAWHQIEIYVHQATGNGAIWKIWLDDVLVYNKTGFSSDPAKKWYPFYMMSNWSNNGPEWAHDANNHIYWDQLEVFSDTGSGGTGNLSDGTITQGTSTQGTSADIARPAAPTSLQVQ